jgi:polysaccharide pyruvyl transferase WcaK-like protein
MESPPGNASLSQSLYHEQHLIVLLSSPGGTSNSGDVLVQRIAEECVRSYGRLYVQSQPGDPTYGRGKRYREFLSLHFALLKAVSRGWLDQNVRATLILPPGQSVTKSLADGPRVAGRIAYLGVLRLLGVRIVLLGRSFSSTNVINWLQEIGLSHVAHQYTLRDAASIRRARSMGIRNAMWFPDWSWLAPVRQSTDVFGARSSVVLSFRADATCLQWDNGLASAILEKVGGFLDEAQDVGVKDVVLVQHASEDEAITSQIERKYHGMYRFRREPGVLSLAKIPRVYGEAALVFSNRLHSLLLGLQWGAVPVAIVVASEPEKLRDQLEDINLAEHIVDLAAPNRGRGIIELALNRQNAVNEAVATYRLRAIRTARRTLAALFNSQLRRGFPEDKIDTRVLYQQLYEPTNSAPSALYLR